MDPDGGRRPKGPDRAGRGIKINPARIFGSSSSSRSTFKSCSRPKKAFTVRSFAFPTQLVSYIAMAGCLSLSYVESSEENEEESESDEESPEDISESDSHRTRTVAHESALQGGTDRQPPVLKLTRHPQHAGHPLYLIKLELGCRLR